MIKMICDRRKSKLKEYIIKIFEDAKINNKSITYEDISRILTIRYVDAKRICDYLIREKIIKF